MTDPTSYSRTAAPPPQSRRRRLIALAIIVISLAGMFGPSLVAHMRHAAEPLWFNDDCRAYIWPMLRYHDPSLFQNDYITQHFLDVMPSGYKLLYRGWSMLADPRVLSKALPYALLLVFLATVGVTGWKLAGPVAAWGAIALCLSSSHFLGCMTGGLPRAFAFPVVGAAAMALTLGRPIVLAVVVCLGAALYAASGLVSGVALAIYLLLLPAPDRAGAQNWSLRRRMIVVAITALISGLMVLPTMIQTRAYGSMIHPDQITTYPEAGPGGRYSRKDRPPYRTVGAEAMGLIHKTLVGGGDPWPGMMPPTRYDHDDSVPRIPALLICVVCLGAAGATLLATRNEAVKRLLILLLAVLLIHPVAVVVAPLLHLPARYVDYPVPVLTVLLIPVGAFALGSLASAPNRAWLRPAAILAICLASLLGLGGRGNPDIGYTVRVDPKNTIYRFLASLPNDAVIAGWPYGLLDNVPYLSQRRTLITFENHAVFHQEFVKEMRRRMIALIEAYFATDLPPLTRLRKDFGVTHLVLDLRHYSRPPAYFKPFGAYAAEMFRKSRQGAIEAEWQLTWAGVYREDHLAVLDLNQLRPQ